MTYPFESLPENLAAFCAVLRDAYRFRVGPRELQDAARALEIADLGDERAVRDTLRPVLTGSFDDLRVFDLAFDRFFHGAGPAAPPRDALASLEDGRQPADARRRLAGQGPEGEPLPSGQGAEQGTPETGGSGRGTVHEVSEDAAERAIGLLRTSYSPLEAEGAVPDLEPATREWRHAAAVLVSRVQRGLSRRWVPARRGPRFDLRRALRGSLPTGGDVVLPRWRTRPRRGPRFLLLVDGSRSMTPHAVAGLRMAVALSAVTPHVETFTFSTGLRRVTRDVRRAAAGERRTLHLQHAWGGGTAIGACLRDFLRRFGDRLLTRDTVAIVVSDGLDVGEAAVLRGAMARLSRRAAAVVWLNPLLDTPGYAPTAAGMSAARPFVTRLAAVNDAAGLTRLARTVRL